MLKNLAFMGGTTFVRLLSGAALLVLVARALGPEAYGRFAFAFSLSMVGAMVVEFGHANLMMREMGLGTRSAQELLREVFRAKAVLGLGFAAVALVLLCSGLVAAEDRPPYLALVLAAICITYGDSFNVAFRGVDAFGTESANVTAASLLHMAIVAPVALLAASPAAVAYAYAASRLLYAGLSYRAFRARFGVRVGAPASLAEWRLALAHLRGSLSYAGDGALVTLRGYTDVWVVNLMLGSTALGIYQAGMNVVRAIENLGPVIANVYLPRIAGRLQQPAALRQSVMHLHLLMYGSGIALLAAFVLAPARQLTLLLGTNFAPLVALLPFFGLYLLARFVAISQGVLVTAHGLQASRTRIGIGGLLFLIAALALLVQPLSIVGAAVAGILCAQFIALLFFVILRRRTGVQVGSWAFVAVSLAITVATACLVGLNA